MAASRAPELKGEERIERYVSAHQAIVRASAMEISKRKLLVSSMPMRVEDEQGRQRKVSTALISDGDVLVPDNALVKTRVGRSAGAGFSFSDAGVSIKPSAAAGAGDGELVGSDRVFWSNVATDTDLVAAMLPDGLAALAVEPRAAARGPGGDETDPV